MNDKIIKINIAMVTIGLVGTSIMVGTWILKSIIEYTKMSRLERRLSIR